MKKIEDILAKKLQVRPLPSDFEARVFAGISSKKRQRRVALATSMVSAALGCCFALFLLLPHGKTGSQSVTGPATAAPVLARSGQAAVNEPGAEKEVIPVMEDVYFSSYDQDTQYAIEQVSWEDTGNGI